MGKQPLEITPPNGQNDFDNLSVEYKLKLIAYQDEIFRAKKKLQESDIRMNDLQNKLDNYLHNKENQLAEIMFTAHTNAQRIENQARSQIQYYLDEMEMELQRKQQEIELIEQKTSTFDQALITPSEPLAEVDKSARLTVLEGSAGDSQPTRKIEKLDVSPEEALPTAKKKRLVSSKKARPAQPVDKVELPSKLPKPKAEENEIVAPDEEVTAATDVAAEIAIETVEAPIDVANEEILAEQPEQPITEPTEPVSEGEIGPEEVLEAEPVSITDVQLKEVKEPEPIEVNTVAAQVEEEPAAKTAPAPQAQANERMQLDAFIDVRYFTEESGSKQLNHHALQVTVEVEVPPDNYSVRYTKVSSDVVSTLMRYDNVILNDIYPFNFVAPNPNSIATYFFNLLDDMLSIIDLKLYSMTIVEFPDMCIKVDKRNTAFDNMIHKDKDMFEDIRKSLPACVEAEPRDNAPLTNRLSKLLKKRG